MVSNKPTFAFFGGEPLGVPVLKKLISADLQPMLVVCSPDRPVGRKQTLTPPPLKVYAEELGIEVFQPEQYKDGTARTRLEATDWDVFVVVAYNFILPTWLLNLPTHNTINLHPSMLPSLRGASPIRSAILRDEPESVGVSVMLLDEKMDHGPILEQEAVLLEEWPPKGPELDALLAATGGELLAEVLPEWVAGNIDPQEQDHAAASYCGRFTKEDSKLDIDPLKLPKGAHARQAWLKINAFAGIGDTYFIHENKRVKVTKAELTEGQLQLQRVVPEGKPELDFAQYLQSLT